MLHTIQFYVECVGNFTQSRLANCMTFPCLTHHPINNNYSEM